MEIRIGNDVIQVLDEDHFMCHLFCKEHSETAGNYGCGRYNVQLMLIKHQDPGATTRRCSQCLHEFGIEPIQAEAENEKKIRIGTLEKTISETFIISFNNDNPEQCFKGCRPILSEEGWRCGLHGDVLWSTGNEDFPCKRSLWCKKYFPSGNTKSNVNVDAALDIMSALSNGEVPSQCKHKSIRANPKSEGSEAYAIKNR